MFGLAAIWKRRTTDRLTQLAKALEAATANDLAVMRRSDEVDRHRIAGAVALHQLCGKFVDELNRRLSSPDVALDPVTFTPDNFNLTSVNLFQINLRGRLLQIEFNSTDDLWSAEDYKRRYVLRGTLRAFNQDSLNHNAVSEQPLFYCPLDDDPIDWYCFDPRTYRSAALTVDYLAAEMQHLV